jgi:hypothetical protein
MDEWTSVPSGSPWDRMKPLGSHMTTEQTNRRQEQKFRMGMKRCGFAGRGKRQGKSVRVCWAGSQHVRWHGPMGKPHLLSCDGGFL